MKNELTKYFLKIIQTLVETYARGRDCMRILRLEDNSLDIDCFVNQHGREDIRNNINYY